MLRPRPPFRNDLSTGAAFVPGFASLSVRPSLEANRAMHCFTDDGLSADLVCGGYRAGRRSRLGLASGMRDPSRPFVGGRRHLPQVTLSRAA